MSKITLICLVIAIVCNLPFSKGIPQHTWDVVDSRSDERFRYFTHYQKREEHQIGTKQPRSTFVLYIMFNPSTGGVNADDPTINRIKELTEVNFPTVNGFKILNLFAYMNPLPEKLLQTLHVEEQHLLGQHATQHATQQAFNIVKGQGNEPATTLWTEAADEAEHIIAAWGNLPVPIPGLAALTRPKFANHQDLVRLIIANRDDWRQKWIPMINARKNEIANWLNGVNYRGKRGYFLLSTMRNNINPRHPLFLRPNNPAHNFKNKAIPILRV